VALETGAVIAGRYRLETLLGHGGMGVVWSAVHTITRKRVALKFLKGPAHLRPEMRRRFIREARAASAVEHPNVIEVHDVFELDDQTPVMVMDLLEGETLGHKLLRDGPLELEETAGVMVPVVSAVGTAHAAGVVHRDLKPDNVFLARTKGGAPDVRVLDFGIAKLVGAQEPETETGNITGTGSMIGTPCYMSPEQAYGEKNIDHRSDVWALGVMLYECLTGGRPIEGDSIGQVVKQLVSAGITPLGVIVPELPADVTDLVGAMLKRDAAQRPSDLREVLAVLERHTTTRAPHFGPAASAPVPSLLPASSGPTIVVRTGPADPVGDTQRSAGTGPESAGPQTVTPIEQPRSRRIYWIAGLALLAIIGAASFWPSSGPVAAGGRSPAPPVAPAALAGALIPSPAAQQSGVKPAASPPAPSIAADLPRALERRNLRGRPLKSQAKAPGAAPRSSSVPAPEPQSSTPKQGGLVEQPPF
jgi:eukaryotic-like serine/threonine-protein kinase